MYQKRLFSFIACCTMEGVTYTANIYLLESHVQFSKTRMSSSRLNISKAKVSCFWSSRTQFTQLSEHRSNHNVITYPRDLKTSLSSSWDVLNHLPCLSSTARFVQCREHCYKRRQIINRGPRPQVVRHHKPGNITLICASRESGSLYLKQT